MEITQQIRDYAAKKGIEDTEALEAGLREKAGGEVYLPAKQGRAD